MSGFRYPHCDMKSAFRWIFLAVLAAAAAWYVAGHGELLHSLGMVPPASFALLLALALSEELLQGAQLRWFCRAFGARLRFGEWFGLTVCNTMYDYFIPGRAATGARAYYLKKRLGLAYGHFGAIFVVSNVLNLAVASIVAAACLLLSSLSTGDADGRRTVALALLAMPVAGALFLALLPRMARRLPLGRLREKIEGFSGGTESLLRRADVLLAGAATQLLKTLAAAAGFFICCRALGAQIGFGQAVLIQSVGAFAILLPLTPGGLGIKEGVVWYLSSLIGLPGDMAAMAALVQRAASVAVVFGFGLYYSHALVRELGNGNSDEDTGHLGVRDGGHSAGDSGD